MDLCKKFFSAKILVTAVILLFVVNVIRYTNRKAKISEIRERLSYPQDAWFFRNGSRLPSPLEISELDLFPKHYKNNVKNHDDRILKQLMYTPKYPQGYEERVKNKILLYDGLSEWPNIENGLQYFQRSRCPVKTCEFTADLKDLGIAALVVFKQEIDVGMVDDTSQIKLFYTTESPVQSRAWPQGPFTGWTATYRLDSDLVVPFLKWLPYKPEMRLNVEDSQKNYALSRTSQVAWYLEDCSLTTNHRHAYVALLKKYISVDIYGNCGAETCDPHRNSTENCFKSFGLRYKFFLAFEDANCQDYIGNSFLLEALQNDLLPVVMGADISEYAQLLPYNSFLHVKNFSSPAHLAKYLHALDRNDFLYNSYFQWKGTGEFIDTHFWCRACAMLHAAQHKAIAPTSKDYLQKWWSKPGVCEMGLQIWQRSRKTQRLWEAFCWLVVFALFLGCIMFGLRLCARGKRNVRPTEAETLLKAI